jgi:SAM-dependent methyltransferase
METVPVANAESIANARALYRALLGREIDEGALNALASAATPPTNFEQGLQLAMSSEYLTRLTTFARDAHLYLIHRARQIMVRRLLPPADHVIDLGGAAAPLYTFGWTHTFVRMVLVDLAPADRHEAFRDLVMPSPSGTGEVAIHYGDMTRLERYPDESFDLVWSGESIEHVDRDAGRRMTEEAMRVLRPGGHFCLDTPNRRITEIHTRPIGGRFVHPDHKYEYHADDLRELLVSCGFDIAVERGVCEMPQTLATGAFEYEDFVLGNVLTDKAEDGYILYFDGAKPA